MFSKGTLKEKGVDITLKNNPGHVLSPDDWDKVLDVKFGKISVEEYKTWYTNLLRDRWISRRDEIVSLAKEGLLNDIKLKCFCPKNTPYCHAEIAAKFLNNLVSKLKEPQK
jgi:hypothetical protein